MSGITPNNTTKQIINNAIVKKLNNLETEVNTLEEGVVTVQDDISDVQNDIQDVQGNIETIQGNISDLNGSVTDINAALEGKQSTLTFDNEPRTGSNNPVKSGGIYDALETKLDKESVKFDPEPNGTDALSTGGAYDIVQDISERIDNIQNQGALLSNDNVDISNNGCLKIDNQQEVETDAIEVLNGDTKLKDTEINGDLSVSGNIDGNVATHSANGLMSSEDKVRLDAIDSSLEDKTVSDTLTDSSTVIPSCKAVSDVISSLDASSVGGSGKYISEISETNGVITATSEDIDTVVTSGSSNPITSGGVYSAFSEYIGKIEQVITLDAGENTITFQTNKAYLLVSSGSNYAQGICFVIQGYNIGVFKNTILSNNIDFGSSDFSATKTMKVTNNGTSFIELKIIRLW